jgi:hypothetical protein
VAPSAAIATATATRTVAAGQSLPFATPSRNIGCVMTATFVRCDVRERAWTLPTKPATCAFDWGYGAVLDSAAAALLCGSDTVLGADLPVLSYGQAATAGTMTCLSAQAGVTCLNTANNTGFFVSRETYHLF